MSEPFEFKSLFKFLRNSNKDAYESDNLAKHYAGQSDLQKPERKIFDIMKEKLPQMKMLDIGVGGGRTTANFSPIAREYIGIDYANKMVEVCQKRFPELSISLGDVRDLSQFESESFDFILFSYNGIDYISHEDRLKGFREIIRVLKPHGYFCFSTHNSLSIPNLYRFKWERGFKKMLVNLYMYFMIRFTNFRAKRTKEYQIISDGALNFQLKTYYIDPISQIEQLKNEGFSSIRIFSYNSGEEWMDNFQNMSDPWIYYFCKNNQ